MATLVRRTIRSTPYRDSLQTWNLIVDMLTRGSAGVARDTLLTVKGIASSIITDRVVEGSPIVVTCDGPRTRVYCLYDDDAIEGSKASESPLNFDPLSGDWRVSLPCQSDDLSWVQAALKNHGERITARDATAGFSDGAESESEALSLDPKGFLKS
ncbi:MAG: hypothetical protein ACYC9Q_02770 [Bacillota bacterium]